MNRKVSELPHTVEPAGIDRRTGLKGRSRFVFHGITTPSGKPIRFKTLDRAERHIRNVNPRLLASGDAR